jgi:hypothetical protein
MEELKFNCPAYLAQRFWLLCAERQQTPGSVLRDFMLREISACDAAFDIDLRSVTGQDAWSISQGHPRKQDGAPA